MRQSWPLIARMMAVLRNGPGITTLSPQYQIAWSAKHSSQLLLLDFYLNVATTGGTSKICFCHIPKRISLNSHLSDLTVSIIFLAYHHPCRVWHSYTDHTMPNDTFSTQTFAPGKRPVFCVWLSWLIPSIVVRSPIESSKKLAAYTAVDHYVKPQHTVSSLTQATFIIPHHSQIIGIGSGMWARSRRSVRRMI